MRTWMLATLGCVLSSLSGEHACAEPPIRTVRQTVPAKQPTQSSVQPSQPNNGKFYAPIGTTGTTTGHEAATAGRAGATNGRGFMADAIAPLSLINPRAALHAFLQATAERDFAAAARCLDFTGLKFDAAAGSHPTFLDQERLVQRLRAALDKLGAIDLARISDDPMAQPVQLSVDPKQPALVLARGRDGLWRFTSDTLARLPNAAPSPHAAVVQPAFFKWTLTELQEFWHLRVPFIETEVSRLVWSAIILLLALLCGRLLRLSLGRAARKLEERGKALSAVTLGALSRSVYLVIFTRALAAAVQVLDLPPLVEKGALAVVESLMAATIGYIVWRLVDVVTFWLSGVSARTNSRLDDMLVPLVSKCLRVAIVVLVLAQVANTLSGQTVTSVLAGLGIGGLAIGLAAQDTIKNLFGSVMIFGDRPFEMGDRIVVDGHDGPVEMVGFRSTRLRTSDGHLVTIPNGELANKTILNMGKPPHLKRAFTVKLDSGTSPDKVEQAVQILKAILKDHEGLHPKRPPTVQFTEIAEQALHIAVAYYFTPPDTARLAALNERVNFEILRRFKEAEIVLASASHTLHLAAETRPKLAVTPEEIKALQQPATARSALSMQDIKPRRMGA